MNLTPKQKAFAENYIIYGNATEAAKKAGYKFKNMGADAAKILKNPKVALYIAELMGSQDKQRVADMEEVLQFYTSVMRGQVKDQFGLDSSLADRLKAGVELMKRFDGAKTGSVFAVQILDNIPDGDPGD